MVRVLFPAGGAATPGAGVAAPRPHPVADAWRAQDAVYAASARRLVLSAPLRTFLEDARSAGKQPVLTSFPDAWISWFAASALRDVLGAWLLRGPGGCLLSPVTGEPVSGVEVSAGHLSASGGERMSSFDAPQTRAGAVGGVFFDGHIRQRADERTRIGMVAEAIIAGLGDPHGAAGLARMGVEEPLALGWDPEVLTVSMRGQMPQSARFLASGAGGLLASMSVTRARVGLREHVRGFVPGAAGGVGEVLGRVSAVAEVLAERFRPNLVVFSWGQLDGLPGGAGWGQWAGPRPVDVPLAVLLGPPAVRDLRLDITALGREHDVVPLGLRRAPSVLVRFSGLAPLWHQLLAFAHDLDRERVAIATGLVPDPGTLTGRQ